MEVVRPADARAFLELAGPLLERDEGRNQLPLGIAGTLAEDPGAYDVVRYWVARDGDEPVAAALRTEPHDLVLADPASEAALRVLVDAAVADDPALPGVVGNVPFVDQAARGLAAASDRIAESVLFQGVYGLSAVRPSPAVSGSPRVAGEDDRPLLAGWMGDFLLEAVPEPEHHLDLLQRTLDTRLASESSGFWLWEDAGEPVSLAGFSGPTPSGIRVGPVYTPPEHRRRGYASALVAELSRSLLDRGHRRCFLFTDLANPTSNRIYEQIGYERVGDSRVYRLR